MTAPRSLQEVDDVRWLRRVLSSYGPKSANADLIPEELALAKAFPSPAIPQGNLFYEVDFSRTIEFTRRLKSSSEQKDSGNFPLLVLANAVIRAAARTPEVNGTWTDVDGCNEIHIKNCVNLCLVSGTVRFPLSFSVEEAEDMSINELATAVEDAMSNADKAPPVELKGGTLTISDVGALGVDAGTAVVEPGGAVILTLGAIRQRASFVSDRITPRWIATLCLSFDHRVLDEVLSARFLVDVDEALQQPERMFMDRL